MNAEHNETAYNFNNLINIMLTWNLSFEIRIKLCKNIKKKKNYKNTHPVSGKKKK